MTYQLFIQTNKEGVLENFFFDSVEDLAKKKAQLDKEIEKAEKAAEPEEK